MTVEPDFDVLIAGGGPVGAALAGLLDIGASSGSADAALRVGLLAPEVPAVRAVGSAALRPIALSQPSMQLLERLAPGLTAHATPIQSIHVSQRGAFGRTEIRAAEHQLPALGYVADLSDLNAQLSAQLSQSQHVTHVPGELIQWSHHADGTIRVELNAPDGIVQSLATRLLVIADGGSAGPAGVIRDYHQSAIVATVRSAQPHAARAWERFTSHGPLALLPFGDRYAVVWSVSNDLAPKLAHADDFEFCRRLADDFGSKLGNFTNPTPRVMYPLTLRRAQVARDGGVIAIGNAAQTLHPVAGQGLNLGLRDAQMLATQLLQSATSKDRAVFGATQLAERYYRSRALDRSATINATDLLARVFASDFAPLAAVRSLGLTAFDLLPPLRRLLARQMMLGRRGVP